MASIPRPPFQVLAPLRPEEVDALREDIARRGVLVPVEVDEGGNILGGLHRAGIAEELALRYRTIRRRFDSDEDMVEHALKLNLLSRNLGPVASAGAFQRLCRVRGSGLETGASGGKSGATDSRVRH